MIIRIPTTTAAILATATPTCSHHKSKSRAMQQQQQQHTNNNTTFIINTATTQLQQEQHQHQLPASYQPNATPTSMRRAIRTKTTITTTMRRFSLAILQFLLLSCALPPPLQTLLPALLPFTLQQRSLAVEALPITSKPIESTAENLAWQAWLMLPPEQKQLEKSRKVTPKSIFSLPFRECPPGHQLFQSRCIPTVNINQSDLLTQQVLGLFLGSTNDGGTTGAGGNADNAYEFDYGEEEYGLGMGEGESVVMFETPQPYNGGGGGGGAGIAAAAGGALNTQQQQAPHMRDEPLKFNLFEQKYPTSDYETDVSSGSGGVEGSGRPMTDYVPTGGSLAEEGAAAAVSNVADSNGAKVLNSTQFLAAVQGFMQTHNTANKTMNIPNINSTSTAQNTNRTTHEATAPNSQQQQTQGLRDLHAASSNISAFAVDEIDAIILPAVSTSNATIALEDAADGDAVLGSASDDLEPQRISLLKNDASVQLQVTTVIAQTDNTSRRTTVEDGMPKVDEAEDLVAEQSTLTQYLRADALLPLSSVAPFLTTTTIPNVLATTTPSEETIAETTKIPLILTKDERPRSVLPQQSKQNETEAQEMRFVTSTEAESTTNFQIDETTVVEVNEQEEYAKVAGEQTSLLAAISQQQQLEAEKTKVEQVQFDRGGEDITTTPYTLEANEATTIQINGNKLTATKINADETADTATTVVPTSFVENEQTLDETTTQKITATTLQPLLSSVDTAPTTTMNTIQTTTAYSISTTTPSTDRFRSAPAAVTTAVAPSHLLAHKQVAAAVSPAVDTTSTRAQVTDHLSGGKTAAVSAVAEFSEAAANDMPGSGINDLVNVAASDNNKDNNNNKRNKSNRKTPIRIVVKKSAVRTNSEINIEQELRMINDLVKGNRQLAALKMPAIKTTTETSTITTKLPTSAQTKLELKKSANATEHAEHVSVDDLAAVEVEVWRDIAATKETTKEVDTTPMTKKERTTSKTTKETTTQIDTTTKTTQDTTRTQDTTAHTSNMSAYTGGAASATKGAIHERTTNLQASAKMESGSSELAKAEADTANKSKITETARKIIELATKTSAAEPEFEYEFEDTTATNTEANEASFWTRIMPIFGFGGKAAVQVEEQEVEPAEAAVTTQQLAANTASHGSSISSNSSSSGSSSNFSSDNSKSSLSDISSISANDNNNNNTNIVNNLNNNKNADSLIRRNSKIIRIDHLSDNSVATAATITNALEEAPATGTTITTATNTATTITTTAHEHNANTEEPSGYWWLPAGWRLDRGTNEEQQPLLLRLWSAFPESQLKTKVST